MNEKRQKMISFRVDEEVLRALQEIEDDVGSDVISKRKRSVAIRRAILETRDRLPRTKI